jgi:DNA-binding transcriptional LysR family regulator
VEGRLPLRALPTPLPVPTYTLMAVWHPRVDGAPEHVWFRGLLSSAAADLSREG